MLDFWIIEDVLRRERVEDSHPQPFLDLPLIGEHIDENEHKVREEEQKRGVVVIDFGS